MWMLLGILVVGALGGVCMAALRNVRRHGQRLYGKRVGNYRK